jgi:hypothetical protein
LAAVSGGRDSAAGAATNMRRQPRQAAGSNCPASTCRSVSRLLRGLEPSVIGLKGGYSRTAP